MGHISITEQKINNKREAPRNPERDVVQSEHRSVWWEPIRRQNHSSGFVLELGVHLGVHLVDGVDGGGEVDKKLAHFVQAVLLFNLPPFR